MTTHITRVFALWPMLTIGFVVGAREDAGDLERELKGTNRAELAREAFIGGNSKRGAAIFYRPDVHCAHCHHLDANKRSMLGPDLTLLGKGTSTEFLIESILEPSKSIRKGFETVTLAAADGRNVSGLLIEENADEVIVNDPSGEGEGKRIRLKKREIEMRRMDQTSIMPVGLVNSLRSRQEFLDLIRFLREIADGGADRLAALKPSPAELIPTLPEYERHIDHAGMIRSLGRKNFQKGEKIYARVCVNCHGTRERAGSLPTALRFDRGAFKNGADPYALYRTLTYGYGMMTPQTWMVPQQKYDVIHYIREAFLKPFNPSQYREVDEALLAGLPRGHSRGPKPTEIEPWVAMDYGNALSATLETPGDRPNFAYKGIAVRVDPGPGGVSRGRAWLAYEHDTLRATSGWSGREFIDWNGINFNGRHQIHPRVTGEVSFSVPNGVGWADPASGRFDDPRIPARDGRTYGPLPQTRGRYLGLYRQGDRVVLSYEIGGARILETPGLAESIEGEGPPIFTRTLEVGPSRFELKTRLAGVGTAVAIAGEGEGVELSTEGGFRVLRFFPTTRPLSTTVLIGGRDQGRVDRAAKRTPKPAGLASSPRGGPNRWPIELKTRIAARSLDGPLVVEDLTLPTENPWSALIRPTGFDFFEDGKSAAVCTWDGDVWQVAGFDSPDGVLRWRRLESGLFQPLGLKIVNGSIHVGCRDQIVKLVDLDGDGAIDFDECFNSDHQVTEHFHEFAMDLQTDARGDFYYAKAARHGLPAVVPQHGTLLRVGRDGARTEIVAGGFRAPNGVLVNDDGTFFMTDQEGFWIPKNRIDWVRPGRFYGNMWAYTNVVDPSDSAMEQPICWITNEFDRSPGEMVRVRGKSWRGLEGSLLNLSYGNGQIHVVPTEKVGDRMQGGMCALPLPLFPSGTMRGRFHPKDGALYVCGMFAWAGNRTSPGGFHRIRPNGEPLIVPVGLRAKTAGLEIDFADPLDRKDFKETARFRVKVWSLKRSAEYGSKHYDERELEVSGATISADGRTVFATIPKIAPTMGMEIRYQVRSASGKPVEGRIHNSILRLGK